MKAKIKKTGEIVEVICYGGNPLSRSDVLDYVNYIDSRGVEHTEPNHLNYYWDFEPIETNTNDHWQDVRERAAIAAMQSFIGKFNINTRDSRDCEKISKLAIEQADSLIEELKKRN